MFSGTSILHLRDRIIAPALAHVAALPAMSAFDSPPAVDLVLGTMATESGGFRDLRQVPTGPALGYAQIEPATHDDIYTHFLDARPALRARVLELTAPAAPGGLHGQLSANLHYAAVICRLVYWRRPRALPRHGDVAGYATLWKDVYNTAAGKGTTAKFVADWTRWVAPHLSAL